jgi:hypothetical protein
MNIIRKMKGMTPIFRNFIPISFRDAEHSYASLSSLLIFTVTAPTHAWRVEQQVLPWLKEPPLLWYELSSPHTSYLKSLESLQSSAGSALELELDELDALELDELGAAVLCARARPSAKRMQAATNGVLNIVLRVPVSH